MILTLLLALEITPEVAAVDRIGCIDIKAIFNEFPLTAKARQEYSALLEEKNRDIKNLEDEINKLRLELEEIKKTLSQSTEPVSTSIINEKQMLIDEKSKELDIKKKSLEDELMEASKTMSARVMGKLYKIIDEVAREENLSIVIDRADAIWFKDTVDITDAVRRRLSGR